MARQVPCVDSQLQTLGFQPWWVSWCRRSCLLHHDSEVRCLHRIQPSLCVLLEENEKTRAGSRHAHVEQRISLAGDRARDVDENDGGSLKALEGMDRGIQCSTWIRLFEWPNAQSAKSGKTGKGRVLQSSGSKQHN